MEPCVCFPEFPSRLQWDRVGEISPAFVQLVQGVLPNSKSVGLGAAPSLNSPLYCPDVNKRQLEGFFYFVHTGMEREREKENFVFKGKKNA